MTDSERATRLGFVPGPGQLPIREREQIATARHEVHLQSLAAQATPGLVDWRNVGGVNYISAIKDQGGCGSCVAFGVSAAIDAAMRINRQLPFGSPDAGLLQDVSEAQLFYGASRTCDVGWDPAGALAYCTRTGLVPESSYPYTAGNQPGRLPNDYQQDLTQLAQYRSLTDHTATKSSLDQHGPLVTGFTVYDDFYTYKSGVYTHQHGDYAGGHCVCVIGYDDTRQAWLCKNQWGTDWGESGYFWIGYGQCGIDAEMWEITSFARIYSAVPSSATALAGFPVHGASSRLYYMGGEQHVHELGWNDRWYQSDLTTRAVGAPRPAAHTSMTGFAVSGRDSRVYHLTTDGSVNELWWSGGSFWDTGWHDSNLTVVTGAPRARPGSAIGSLAIAGTDSRVYYVSDDGHIHELWWSDRWGHGDLSALTAAPGAVTGSPLACFASGGTQPHVYYIGADGHVHELFYNSDGWSHLDLSQATGAPFATAASGLACFGIGGTSPRVYYVSADGHVHELSWSNAWYDLDLTAHTGSKPASVGTSLAAFAYADTSAWVYYLTEDGHVNELGWAGSWFHNDITALTQGAPASPVSALAAFGRDGSNPRVYYQTDDAHLHELFFEGHWAHLDLTTMPTG
nr:C1 family peptidase [Actinopolymorpha pittospori]